MAIFGTACPHIPHAKGNPTLSRNDDAVIDVTCFTLHDRFVKADILQDFIHESGRKRWLSRTTQVALSFEIGR